MSSPSSGGSAIDGSAGSDGGVTVVVSNVGGMSSTAAAAAAAHTDTVAVPGASVPATGDAAATSSSAHVGAVPAADAAADDTETATVGGDSAAAVAATEDAGNTAVDNGSARAGESALTGDAATDTENGVVNVAVSTATGAATDKSGDESKGRDDSPASTTVTASSSMSPSPSMASAAFAAAVNGNRRKKVTYADVHKEDKGEKNQEDGTGEGSNSNSHIGMDAAFDVGRAASVFAKKAAQKATKNVVKTIKTFPNVLNSSDKDYRWEELQKIEKRRREILQRIEVPFWQTLTFWHGTVLEILVGDGLFWFTMLLYFIVRVLARTELPSVVSELGSSEFAVLGGFLSFFLVFYVNQNNKRYFGLYKDSMGCKGRIFDTATLAVTCLPRDIATRLVRYMNAAHAAGYVGLSQTYPSGSYFSHVNETLGLLTDSEMERMNEIDLDSGGSCNRELIAWCMMEIKRAHEKGLLDKELANTFRTQILQLRASIGALYNAADLPVPFFYVHFICILTAMYLPLFAINAGINAGTGDEVYWTADIIAGMSVILQAVFVIGLRTLGQKISDPYGDDLVDLSVMFYVNFTWTHSNRILNAQFPEEVNAEVEEDILRRRKSIGTPWEDPIEFDRDQETAFVMRQPESTDSNTNVMDDIDETGEATVSNGGGGGGASSNIVANNNGNPSMGRAPPNQDDGTYRFAC